MVKQQPRGRPGLGGGGQAGEATLPGGPGWEEDREAFSAEACKMARS